jgi:hypothetical protein
MARLPSPGGDSGTWGNVLNDFLDTIHNADGTLKDNVVSSTSLAPNAVDASSIQDATISESKLDAALAAKVNTASSGVAPDATTSVKGIVRLQGDLAGTADTPTVPGLAGKEPTITAGTTGQYYRGDKTFQTLDKTAVGLGNVDNTSDANKPVSSATTTALNTKANNTVTVTGATSLTGGGNLTANRTISLVNDSATPGNTQYYGTDGTGTKGFFPVPAATIANGSITPAKLNSDTPANGEVLSYNGTGFEWITPASGGGAVSSVNGKTGVVTLVPGDIAGFATVATSGAYNDLTGKPAAAIPLTSQATWPIVPAATTATVDYNTGSSSYPARPTSRTDIVVRWRGPVAPAVGGTGAVDNVDEWVNTP